LAIDNRHFLLNTYTMSLRNIDIEGGLRRLADRRIEEAMKDGKFDRLELAGQDIEIEPLPADEKARMMWWALRIMKQNNVVPDEVEWRKSIDRLTTAIEGLTDESLLPGLVAKVNELVHRLNTLGTNAINIPIARLDLEGERARLRARLAARTAE
jgi:hypothetical protein